MPAPEVATIMFCDSLIGQGRRRSCAAACSTWNCRRLPTGCRSISLRGDWELNSRFPAMTYVPFRSADAYMLFHWFSGENPGLAAALPTPCSVRTRCFKAATDRSGFGLQQGRQRALLGDAALPRRRGRLSRLPASTTRARQIQYGYVRCGRRSRPAIQPKCSTSPTTARSSDHDPVIAPRRVRLLPDRGT